jgi:hypothetical protein
MKSRNHFFQNFSNANGSEKSIKKDILLDEFAELIENHKPLVLEAFSRSGVNVDKNIRLKSLTSKVVDQMYENPEFKEHMVLLVSSLNMGLIDEGFSHGDGKVKEFFSNLGMKIKNTFSRNSHKSSGGTADKIVKSTGGGAASAGIWGAVIGLVGGVTQSVFDHKTSQNQLESEKEQTKAELYNKLLGEKKTNWMPIVIVGGVLLMGAVVLTLTLRGKGKK